MNLNIFLFFPETDDQILNDDSKQIILNFFEILKKIKNEIKLFYDAKNVAAFISQNKISEFYLEKEVNKLRIKLSKNSAIDIQTKNLINKECYYFQWNLDNSQVEYCVEILKEIVERKVQFDSEQNILINFNSSIKHCRNRILVFKDSKHLQEFPKNFVHIDFVSDFFEFDIWLKTYHIKDFSLLDRNRFRKQSDKIMKGAIVYYEFNEDRYWHIDTFHDYIEYEVYDKTGNHSATADEYGKIDFSKGDSKKKNILS